MNLTLCQKVYNKKRMIDKVINNNNIMEPRFFPDSLAEAFAKIIAASLPFITMGLIDRDHPALIIAAGSVGGIALFAFLIRLAVLFRKPARRCETLDRIMNGMTFPYLFGLSFGIGIEYGEHAGWYGVWFSLFLAAWIIIANCVQQKQGKE